MPFNPLGIQPKIRNGLRGEALVVRSAAGPDATAEDNEGNRGHTGMWRVFTAETWLIVRAPGHPPFFDQSQRHATREKYAVIGMHLPVDVSPDLRKAAIVWKEAPTVDEFIASGAPTFTDPDALHAELQAAWKDVVAHHGGVVPQRMARAPIDGPSARVMALGHGANSYDTVMGKWEMLLSVAEPGSPRYGYRWRGKIPYKTLVLQGQDLPIEVTSKGIEIPWDRIRSDVQRRLAALDPTGQLGQRQGLGANLKMLRDAGRKLQAVAANPELLAYRAHISNIMATGVEMPATITAVTVGEWQAGLNGFITQLSLTVEPQSQPAYETTFTQPLPQTVTPTLAVGQRVTVRVARDDAQAVMLWNTPHAAGGASPDTGRTLASPAPVAPEPPPRAQSEHSERITMLERLSEMHASGALTDAEFDAAKSRILGS
jgi:hypothetical protein